MIQTEQKTTVGGGYLKQGAFEIASFCDRWGDTSDSMHTLCNDLDNSAGDLISNTELFLGDNLMADGQ